MILKNKELSYKQLCSVTLKKRCRRCNKILDSKNFCRSSHKKDGLWDYCRGCNKEIGLIKNYGISDETSELLKFLILNFKFLIFMMSLPQALFAAPPPVAPSEPMLGAQFFPLLSL